EPANAITGVTATADGPVVTISGAGEWLDLAVISTNPTGLVVDIKTFKSVDAFKLTQDEGVDWSYTWDSTGGVQGFGKLNVSIGGEKLSVELPNASTYDAIEITELNTFGIWQDNHRLAIEEIFNTLPPGVDQANARIFVDDVYYTVTSDPIHFGDSNIHRDQGAFSVTASTISNSDSWGILSDDGPRVATEGNHPHPGPVRNLSQLNSDRLVPGVSIINNLLYGNGDLLNNTGGAIRYSGSATLVDGDVGAVPYGRILNNTLYGTLLEGGAGGTGIRVDDAASPTILNNIIVNFDQGIDVDLLDSATTVVGGSVYHGNTDGQNSNAAIESFSVEYDPSASAACSSLFVAPTPSDRIFYLCGGDAVNVNPAIDSSIASVPDRYDFVLVKEPIEISPSPVIAPGIDLRGQLRIDDPSTEPVGGIGQNVFIDRGAIDRADFAGPTAKLIGPLDNDPLEFDINDGVSVVNVRIGDVVSNFEIRLNDGNEPGQPHEGIGIWDKEVTSETVIVRQDGELLFDDIDYSFSYNDTNDTIRLTPIAGIWEPNSIYTIELSNIHHWKLDAQTGLGIADGDFFTIKDEFNATADFEFDRGYSIDVPQTFRITLPESAGGANGIVDGDTFFVREGITHQGFEFDLNSPPQVLPGNIAVPYTLNDNVDSLASSLITVLATANLGLNPVYLGDGVVHLGTNKNHTVNFSGTLMISAPVGVAGGIEDAGYFTIDNGSRFVRFEFEDTQHPNGPAVTGLPDEVILIDFTTGDTTHQIAQSIATEIRNAGLGLDDVAALDDGVSCYLFTSSFTDCVHVGGEAKHVLDTTGTQLTSSGTPGVRPEYGLLIPTKAGKLDNVNDEDEFTITFGVGPTPYSVTFELNDPSVDPVYDVANYPIPLDSNTTPDQLMDDIVVAIKSASLELDPFVVPDTFRIQLGATNQHTLSIGKGGFKVRGGVPGTRGAVEVDVLPLSHFDAVQTAVSVVDAINGTDLLSGVVARPNQSNELIVTGALSGTGVQKFTSTLFVDDEWNISTPREMSAIIDMASNELLPNQYSGRTLFTIQLGTSDYDMGDAPDGIGVAPQNSYPTNSGNDPAIHMYGQDVFLGERVDRDTEGQPSILDELDGEGYVVDTSLTPGVQFSTRKYIVTVSGAVEAEVLKIGTTDFEIDTAGNGVTTGNVPVVVAV
ncbi:MAG: right-handed parallel beta-helix repeat-containing protein, partial [Planctomycetaceae bacterium]|nr:right-handed parallel beta-helix repeat-containing protein [Planctomycetaceae bacterium]